ncbi:MAG: molybdate ABC transporter substrate-binding protein [Planctomycetaceae bacterium]|nr:molybdate ABC transporter substrate-binding protein [Planctomycetaceae bacterium]
MPTEWKVLLGSVVLAGLLVAGLAWLSGHESVSGDRLMLYCAAGSQKAVAPTVERYRKDYGVAVEVQYGGSGTLLSSLKASGAGDLYLAADQSYIQLAQSQGLLAEVLPLARTMPVIVVQRGNTSVTGLDDLLKPAVRVAMGNPKAASIGRTVQQALTPSGQWALLDQAVQQHGVFKPTVSDIANDVAIGAVDAGIVWDSTVAQYGQLKAVHVPALDAAVQEISIGVLKSSRHPTAALTFARYLAARDRGLDRFKAAGFTPVDGDTWAVHPRLKFYCGAVNRRAVEEVVKAFEAREGVTVETVYNGCGTLTGQMKSMGPASANFPDVYMACDRYYLNNVRDWFQEDVDISDADIVIAVPKGSTGIKGLADLARPGVRVAVGQGEQCTIGALTRILLQKEGLYDAVMKNVVMQTASSAMLVPTVTTKSVDAAIAYRTDTLAERGRIDVVAIDSPYAKAVQPFSIARGSPHKQLARRFFSVIAAARENFKAAGFNFRYNDKDAKPQAATAPKE